MFRREKKNVPLPPLELPPLITTPLHAPTETAIDKLLPRALEILKLQLNSTPVNLQSLHLLIKYVVELVESTEAVTTEINNTHKKEFAIKLMREIINEMPNTASNSESLNDKTILLRLLNDGVLSNLIDVLIHSKKNLKVNKAGFFSKAFKTISPYLLKLLRIGLNKLINVVREKLNLPKNSTDVQEMQEVQVQEPLTPSFPNPPEPTPIPTPELSPSVSPEPTPEQIGRAHV